MLGKGGNATANQVQWYYPVGVPATPTPYHHLIPYYAYTPTPSYFASAINYINHKVRYSNNGGGGGGGAYTNCQLSPMYPAVVGANNTMMPVYPVCHIPQMQTMGIPAAAAAAHIYHQATPPSLAPTMPTMVSKAPSIL